MAKLLFKESPLENVVIRSLDNGLEYLNDANRQIGRASCRERVS